MTRTVLRKQYAKGARGDCLAIVWPKPTHASRPWTDPHPHHCRLLHTRCRVCASIVALFFLLIRPPLRLAISWRSLMRNSTKAKTTPTVTRHRDRKVARRRRRGPSHRQTTRRRRVYGLSTRVYKSGPSTTPRQAHRRELRRRLRNTSRTLRHHTLRRRHPLSIGKVCESCSKTRLVIHRKRTRNDMYLHRPSVAREVPALLLREALVFRRSEERV